MALLLVPCASAEVQLGLRLPDGFEVVEFAGSDLANDIHTLTIDLTGRVIVAGRGYIRILEDRDGDGKVDRVLEFATTPRDGAMGLLWEGDSLYCTGDGGLRRFRDANGDGKADGPSELIYPLKTGGEHTAHAIHRGPDGWLYVLVGDSTGIDERFVTSPRSPVRQPLAGCVLRFSPDFKQREVVADGFRNPYGMDFNSAGELFTYDSDNERCVTLPWYEPTRFYHVVAGGRYGWRKGIGSWWRLPPGSVDIVAPVCTLGRGSPTAVVCYRHGQFPARYRDGFFLLDWTFGVIHFVAPRRTGSTWTGTGEIFLRSVGDSGFAPTGAAVHPVTGDLFVSIGGRGTRGAVYRIRFPRGLAEAKKEAGKYRLTPRSLDWEASGKESLLRAATGSGEAARRALELILRHREQFTGGELRQVIGAADRQDRLILQAAARLVATLSPRERATLEENLGKKPHLAFGLGIAASDPARALQIATRLLESGEQRLQAVRLMQIALGDLTARSSINTVLEGYTLRRPPRGLALAPALAALRRAFPSKEPDLDRELTRTLGLLEDDSPQTLQQVAGLLTTDSHPSDDIHALIVISRLKASRTATLTRQVAGAMLALDEKVAKRKLNRDNNWAPRLRELHRELAARDAGLNAALLAHAEFGRADHVVWVEAPGLDRRKAAEIFLARAAKQAEFPWNAGLIQLLAELPEERSLPVLRKLWGQVGLDDVLLPLLARQPREEDRERFLRGLTSPQLALVRSSLSALEKLPARKSGESILAVLLALRRLPSDREAERVRQQMAGYLTKLSGVTQPDVPAWVAWFRKTYPNLAGRLADDDGVDVAGWARRLDRVPWERGDAARGARIYARAACASCHSGAQALGPDLAGVAGRFSRADLFTAILQPSKDVSTRYRTTSVTTADGKIYQGIIIYEAVDGLLLQTGPAATVRIANRQIVEKRLTAASLMPAGLLDSLKDEELADLYAYLRSLGVPRPRRRRCRKPASFLLAGSLLP